MRTALVTGSAGFIGRHMVRALRAANWGVLEVDLKTGGDCRTLFRSDERFDLVVHCAAVVGGRMTIDREPMKVAVDLAIDADLFGYVLRTKPERVVYFSSSAAYPTYLQSPKFAGMHLHEDDLNLDNLEQPDAIYGWVKLTGEQLARHANEMGARVHIFRPFSGYGGDQDLDYPFPSFIARARDHQHPFEVWGTGEQTRDFVHVDDVVAAVLRVIPERPQDVGPLNLCTGQATSFIKLAEMVMKSAGYLTRIQTHPDRPVGVMHRVGSPAQMNRFYTAKVSLEEGIDRALRAT